MEDLYPQTTWRITNPSGEHLFGLHIEIMKLSAWDRLPQGGILLAQMLNMVEKHNIREMGYGSADTVHLMIEVERRAFADRATHLGDPDFYPVPIGMLINKQYARFRTKSIAMNRASLSEAIGPGSAERFSESSETTHLSVIDKDGNAVALTTTLNGGVRERYRC